MRNTRSIFCNLKSSISFYIDHSIETMYWQGSFRNYLDRRAETLLLEPSNNHHDGIIKWKHFPRYWPFVRRIHRSLMNSPHIGQWCGALMVSWIWACMNDRVNNREAGDLRRHHAHYDVTIMTFASKVGWWCICIMHSWYLIILVFPYHQGKSKCAQFAWPMLRHTDR